MKMTVLNICLVLMIVLDGVMVLLFASTLSEQHTALDTIALGFGAFSVLVGTASILLVKKLLLKQQAMSLSATQTRAHVR